MSEELSVKEQVQQAVDEAAAPAAEKSSEVVADSSVKDTQEVKEETIVESKPEVKQEKAPEKLEEQIKNLNVALQQEREAKRQKEEAFQKELTESREVIEKLKSVFVEPEVNKPEEAPKFLTQEEVEAWYSAKEAEKQRELFEKQQVEKLTTEIQTLEKMWDGQNGKPKYDDAEVINWQKNNNKLYLSPVEAFEQMKKSEIIDWEIKQRMSSRGKDVSVEKPGGGSIEHNTESLEIKNVSDLRKVILEAIETADADI